MKKSFYLLVIALLLTSCGAPRVVSQLTPEAPEGHYEMGREYISLSNDKIDVELGYDGIHGEHLVFDFVVINQTPRVLTINPSDFYYVLLDSATADSSMFPKRMAVHPERILHHYDENLEAREGAKSMNSILGFLDAGVGLLANTTAFIATEDPGYIFDALFGTIGTAENYVALDKQISADISMIHSEKEIVDEEIFRMDQLPPGKVISGYVYFPKYPETDYYMFCFPVEDQLFQFVYNQRRVYQYY
ncbi:MAG: hypothetical protein ABFS38_07760 [Bacteroidota bacterium]